MVKLNTTKYIHSNSKGRWVKELLKVVIIHLDVIKF